MDKEKLSKILDRFLDDVQEYIDTQMEHLKAELLIEDEEPVQEFEDEGSEEEEEEVAKEVEDQE